MQHQGTETKDRTEYHRAISRVYEGELNAIEEMLDVAGVPRDDEQGEPIPPRRRVRLLIEQRLALVEAGHADR